MGRVRVRPLVDAHRVPVDELAAEPTRHRRHGNTGEGQGKGNGFWSGRLVTAQEPAHREQDEEDQVAETVDGPTAGLVP